MPWRHLALLSVLLLRPAAGPAQVVRRFALPLADFAVVGDSMHGVTRLASPNLHCTAGVQGATINRLAVGPPHVAGWLPAAYRLLDSGSAVSQRNGGEAVGATLRSDQEGSSLTTLSASPHSWTPWFRHLAEVHT
jgi:hypothetical protein